MLKNKRKSYAIMFIWGILISVFTINTKAAFVGQEKNSMEAESEEKEKTNILETAEMEYTFWLNNIMYTGIYTGEIEVGKPNGQGTFTSDKKSPYLFTYNGEFEQGLFNGQGEIIYENGDSLKGRFLDGVPTGKMNLEHPDGDYAVIYYGSGIPCRVITEYSKDGTLIKKDFFYDGHTLSDWKKGAIKTDYRELYQNAQEYLGELFEIDCTVVYVYEDQSTCKFQVKDDEENIYWGEYQNTVYQTFSQSIMPTLKKGDKLKLYGFFIGVRPYSWADDKQMNNSYPKLIPLTAEVSDMKLDYGEPSKDYEEVLRFPYHYYNIYDVLEITVNNFFYAANKYYICGTDDEGHIYYCHIKISENVDNPIPGDKVRVSGFYRGLYKEYNTNNQETLTELHLYMEVSSIKILK